MIRALWCFPACYFDINLCPWYTERWLHARIAAHRALIERHPDNVAVLGEESLTVEHLWYELRYRRRGRAYRTFLASQTGKE